MLRISKLTALLILTAALTLSNFQVMGQITLSKTNTLDISTPPAERLTLTFDENGLPCYKDENGNLYYFQTKDTVKRFKALVSINSANETSIEILENSLGETPTFTYFGVGLARIITVASLFENESKVFCLIGDGIGLSPYFRHISVESKKVIEIGTFDAGGNFVNNALNKTPILIEVHQ